MSGIRCILLLGHRYHVKCTVDRDRDDVVVPMASSTDRSAGESSVHAEQLHEPGISYGLMAAHLQRSVRHVHEAELQLPRERAGRFSEETFRAGPAEREGHETVVTSH